ncbi:MAG: molybdopterin-dependent oxidoreductase [Dehalococcoidia bacterium]|nr:molybdopterin-dependent oxidoreductase [Dehalococcoidia bacterium]
MFTASLSLEALQESAKRTSGEYTGTEDLYRQRWRWDKVTWATHCVDCYPGNCPYRVFVKDGVILAEEQAGNLPVIEDGVPDMNPMGCQKGAAWSRLLHSPERVLHPLRRAGKRGEGKWKRVSWNEALTGIADHILDAIREIGPEAVIDEGTPGQGGLLASFPFSRVIQLIGGLRTDVNAVINDFSPGIYLTFGKFDPASSMDDAFHAKFIMYTHCNPVYTQMAGYHYTAESRYNGGEVVVVAPDVSPSHVHADYYVPIRPGTDAALGLAMAQVIIDEKLYEAPFIKEQTDLSLLVRLDNRRFLRESDLQESGRDDRFYYWDGAAGRLAAAPLETLALGEVDPALEGSYPAVLSNGRRVDVVPVFELLKERLADYTPEKAAAMCGVNPSVIRNLARKISSRRGTIVCGGTSFKYYHADLMVRAYLLVLGLTGNWGRKGTGPVEWSVAGFDGPFIFAAKQKEGLEETRRILDMREAIHSMIKNEDPTRTDEMAHIEMLTRMSPLGGMVPPAFLWYYHCGYRDNWNRREWGDPTMQRTFDEYFEEARRRGWWQGMERPGPDTPPRVYFEVGGNTLRRTRGGQNQLLPNFWPKLNCIVTVDWRMNTTGMYSDYFLPVAHHYEKLAFMFPAPQVMNFTICDKAVEPPADVRSEVEIALMLVEKIEERAKARGITECVDSKGTSRRLDNLVEQYTIGGAFTDAEKIAREWVQDSVETGNLPPDTSLDTLREKGYVRIQNWGIGAMAYSQAADIKPNETHTAFRWHVDDKLPYPTLTRRAQFYLDHEWFLEAGEELPCHKDNPPQGGDYPFEMTSGHNRWSIHSMNIVNKVLQETHRGRPHVVINDDDASRLGIEDGEEIQIYNDMGVFIAPAKISPSVRPGQVISYNGWEPYTYRTWKGAADVEPGMVKWLHFAGGYGHLRYWPLQWQPVPFDRGIRVAIAKLD